MKLTFNTNGNTKQKEMAKCWVNPTITDIVYGGSKGSGKGGSKGNRDTKPDGFAWQAD